MDRALITRVFTEYRDRIDNLEGVEARLVITDTDFMLMHIGWTRDEKRIYGVLAHFVIRDDKLWIEYNDTGIVDRLVVEGIPHSQIVLAFLPPSYRKYSDYAAG